MRFLFFVCDFKQRGYPIFIQFVGETPYPPDGLRMQLIFRALVLFICRGLHALSVVDDTHFIEFIRMLDPRIRLPSRNTITYNYLLEAYEEAKQRLLKQLESTEFVSLTTDLWSSRNSESYITVTCHYILAGHNRVFSRVLRTVQMDGSATAVNIAAKLKEVAMKWNIWGKIVAVVTDNGANVVAAVRLLNLRQVIYYYRSFKPKYHK